MSPTNPAKERLRDVKLFIELRNEGIEEAKKSLKLRSKLFKCFKSSREGFSLPPNLD